MLTAPRFCVRVHHAGYSYGQLLAIWRTAERLGYDGASLYDVLSGPAVEVWTALTALTLATRHLVGIPLVLDMSYRHPVTLAKMAAGLDLLSGGGRLILGLGYGGDRADHRAYGFPWEPMARRVEQLGEQVRIMRSLWTEPRTTIRGAHFSLRDAPGFPTATPGGPPILVAGRGVRHALRGVARYADLCNVSFDLSPDEWKEYRRVIAEHCVAAGRDPAELGLTHNATVVIGRDRAEAERCLEALARSRNLTGEQARHGLAHALVGTPPEIVEQLLGYRAAGVDLAWVFLLFPDLPALNSLRLFGETVLPAYRAACRP